MNFADRLCSAITDRGTPSCVGLDPVYSRLPAALRERYESRRGSDGAAAVDAIVEFGRGVIEAVAPFVPVMKINSAFFEVYGGRGVDAYFELVNAAQADGLMVIGDVKRADIGHSTTAYARGHLSDGTEKGVRKILPDRPAGHSAQNLPDTFSTPDAVTVNPYLGANGVNAFMEVCRREAKGVFVLVQTSNAAARDVQDARLESGETVAAHVARLVNAWSAAPALMGECGYSAVGAVVSPRDVAGAAALRSILTRCVFLVPGYGAQGQSARQVAHCFKDDGTGALVNSSRGVIYAYEHERHAGRGGVDWKKSVETACRDFIEDINGILNR